MLGPGGNRLGTLVSCTLNLGNVGMRGGVCEGVCAFVYSTTMVYIALFFEAVRKSTDLADGLTQVFGQSRGCY